MCEQLALFSRESAGPLGLRYQTDFISEDEETGLIARIRELPLAPFQFGAFEGKRRVASFGWRFDYSVQRLEQADKLPAWITPFSQESKRSPACHPEPSGCSVRNTTKGLGSGGTGTSCILT